MKLERSLVVLLLCVSRIYSTGVRNMFLKRNPVSLRIRQLDTPISSKSKWNWVQNIIGKTGINDEPRTKSLFFENVLGLKEGRPFVLDHLKWEALKDSGMFKNLSYQLMPQKCPKQVGVAIYGEELSSRKFSPEFAVSSSIFNPDIEGGLRIVDKNFLGMGQFLNLCVSGKRSATQKLGQFGNGTFAMPRIELIWRDRNIGREGYISAGVSAEQHAESASTSTASVGTRLWLKSSRSYNVKDGRAYFDALAYAAKTSPLTGYRKVTSSLLEALSSRLPFTGDTSLSGTRGTPGSVTSSGVQLLLNLRKKGLVGLFEFESGVESSTASKNQFSLRRQRPFGRFKMSMRSVFFSAGGREDNPALGIDTEGNNRHWKSVGFIGGMSMRLLSNTLGGEGRLFLPQYETYMEDPVTPDSDSDKKAALMSAWGRFGRSLLNAGEAVASVKVDAQTRTDVLKIAKPGVFLESSAQTNNAQLIDEASRSIKDDSAMSNLLTFHNNWGFSLNARGLRAAISWKIGDGANKFKLSLDSSDEYY